MTVIQGTADNGHVVLVDLPGFIGPAGLKARDGWAEIAFFGNVDLPSAPITVDGRQAKALRALPTDNAGVMTVLAIAFV